MDETCLVSIEQVSNLNSFFPGTAASIGDFPLYTPLQDDKALMTFCWMNKQYGIENSMILTGTQQ